MTQKDKDEIAFWKRAIRLIKRDYGKGCITKDLEDFPNKCGTEVPFRVRCGSCLAKETVEWIENHIRLIKS